MYVGRYRGKNSFVWSDKCCNPPNVRYSLILAYTTHMIDLNSIEMAFPYMPQMGKCMAKAM